MINVCDSVLGMTEMFLFKQGKGGKGREVAGRAVERIGSGWVDRGLICLYFTFEGVALIS